MQAHQPQRPAAATGAARQRAARHLAKPAAVVRGVEGSDVVVCHLGGCIAIEVAALSNCLICRGVHVELIELCTVYKQASKLTFTRVCEGKEA